MTRLLRSAAVVALLATVLVAWSGLKPMTYTFQSTPNKMNVEGGSTLHDWSCPIETLNGSLTVDTAQTDGQMTIKDVSSAQVRVPVDAIQCKKETMNDKLRKALKMNAYPKVYFSLEDATVSALPDSGKAWFTVDATGELIIAGKRRQIQLPVKGKLLDNGNLRLIGSHTIRLSDYDIERPSALLGTITVSKQVTVNFDVTATPKSE